MIRLRDLHRKFQMGLAFVDFCFEHLENSMAGEVIEEDLDADEFEVSL